MADLDTGSLPPWLTRQYDYAAGFRGMGDAFLKGKQVSLQRDRVALEQQELGLRAAQQKALEAHRKVQEGIEQAQEARQQAIFNKTASNELSRRIGMGMFSDEMEIWRADHPDATPSEELRAQTAAALKHADKMFPDGQGFAPFLQHATQAIGNIGVQESLIEARKAQAELSSERKRALQLKETQDWLNPGGAGKQFAGQPLTQLLNELTKAKAEGRDDDVALYETEIAQRQGKAPFAARSKAHSELASTLRQQMRAIDAEKDLKPAEREARKAVLLRQLDESRRNLLGELEGEQPPVEEQATREAITKLEKEIADVRIDLVKNPKQRRLDFGEDNRSIKLKELTQQRDNLMQKLAPAKPVTATPVTAPSDNLPADYRVKIKAPDGRLFTIPKDQLEDAVKQGYTEVP